MHRIVLCLILSLLPFKVGSEAFIVNPDSGFPKTLPLEEVRGLFFMKSLETPSKDRVQIYILSRDNPATRRFLLDTLHITPSAYFDMIDSYTAVGKGRPPIVVESDVRMMISVGAHRGGIGFIRSPDTSSDLVKIIPIKP